MIKKKKEEKKHWPLPCQISGISGTNNPDLKSFRDFIDEFDHIDNFRKLTPSGSRHGQIVAARIQFSIRFISTSCYLIKSVGLGLLGYPNFHSVDYDPWPVFVWVWVNLVKPKPILIGN